MNPWPFGKPTLPVPEEEKLRNQLQHLRELLGQFDALQPLIPAKYLGLSLADAAVRHIQDLQGQVHQWKALAESQAALLEQDAPDAKLYRWLRDNTHPDNLRKLFNGRPPSAAPQPTQAEQSIDVSKERPAVVDFMHWLNKRRDLPVVEVFHDLVECYRRAIEHGGSAEQPKAWRPMKGALGPLADTEEDPGRLWAEIHTLRAAVAGPDGYATWQDAAVAERVRRVKAEGQLKDALKDAGRYRWLTENKHVPWGAMKLPINTLLDEGIDAAVDEAMSKGS